MRMRIICLGMREHAQTCFLSKRNRECLIDFMTRSDRAIRKQTWCALKANQTGQTFKQNKIYRNVLISSGFEFK